MEDHSIKDIPIFRFFESQALIPPLEESRHALVVFKNAPSLELKSSRQRASSGPKDIMLLHFKDFDPTQPFGAVVVEAEESNAQEQCKSPTEPLTAPLCPPASNIVRFRAIRNIGALER